MNSARSHIYASVGTTVILLLLLLLLLHITIVVPQTEEDEGIEVSFGNDNIGGGMPDARVIKEDLPQPEMDPAPSVAARPTDNDWMVQEDASLELKRQREQEAKQKADAAELARRQREAEIQAEAEKRAKEKALAQQRAHEQQATEKAQQLGALFGQANAAEGANADNYTGQASSGSKGNPIGKGFGSIDGNTYQLSGRTCTSLPKPSSDFKQGGKVVVSIRVDETGNVVSASIGDGTNVSDKTTQRLALDAARKAKFTPGDRPQVGTIIYTFKIN